MKNTIRKGNGEGCYIYIYTSKRSIIETSKEVFKHLLTKSKAQQQRAPPTNGLRLAPFVFHDIHSISGNYSILSLSHLCNLFPTLPSPKETTTYVFYCYPPSPLRDTPIMIIIPSLYALFPIVTNIQGIHNESPPRRRPLERLLPSLPHRCIF